MTAAVEDRVIERLPRRAQPGFDLPTSITFRKSLS